MRITEKTVVYPSKLIRQISVAAVVDTGVGINWFAQPKSPTTLSKKTKKE